MTSRSRGRGRNSGKVNSGTSKPGVAKGYRKGSIRGGARKGRVKSDPDPPRILGLKARKAELSVSFKLITCHQKAALLNLAQKSLDKANNDVHYHENLPEFRKVSRDLDDKLNSLLVKLQAHRRYEEELAKNRLEQNIYLINRQYKNKLNDLKDQGIATVQEHILYVEKMSRTGGQVEEIPFQRGEDGRKVTRLSPPPKIVHPVAIAFKKGQIADEKSACKIGDNFTEQHPANFWLSCTESQKKAITSQQMSIIEANRKISQDEKLGIYRKRTVTASGLFNLAVVPSMEMDVDEDDFQSDDIVTPETAALDDQNQVLEYSDDAAELSLDPYGVRIPRKKFRSSSKARPNNHMIVPRFFDFEDAEGQILEDGSIGIQEIGFRNWTTKNIRNRDYFIGSDASPNPEFFFIPQRVGDINSGNNTIEDMRSVAHIARTHKLHPTLGIVLPGSVNPDYCDLKDPYFAPPSIKNCSLEPLKPHMIIQENSDGTTSVSKVPRSWIRQTNENFKSYQTRNKLASLLSAIGDHAEPKQCLPNSSKRADIIDQELINAALAALEEREANAVKDDLNAPTESSLKIPSHASLKMTSPKASPRPSPKAIRRPPRPQYDPVRDSFPAHDTSCKSKSVSAPLIHMKSHSQPNSEQFKPQTPNQPDSKMRNITAGYISKKSRVPSAVESPRKSPANSHKNISSTASYLNLPQSQTIHPTMHPPINIESQSTQYQNKFCSTHSPKPLSSPQVSQRPTQPHPLKQSTLPTSSYNMIMLPHQQKYPVVYPPYSSPQVTYPPQLAPHTSHAPNLPPLSTLTPDVSAAAPYIPPPPSQTNFTRPLLGTVHNPQPPNQPMYGSQHPTQMVQVHGNLESKSFRDLSHTAPQRSTPPPPPPPPNPTYSWRVNGNYHSHSFPQ